MRHLIPLLLSAAAAAPALDTPLILTPQGLQTVNTELLLEISPGLGVLNYYHATQQSLDHSCGAPFLFELEMLEASPTEFKDPLGITWNALRSDDLQMKERAAEFISKFSTAKQGDLPSPQAAALAAEDGFWTKPHKFDGIVRAAWNLDYVLLAIPSKHALLLYNTTDQAITLTGWMNYGPLLLVDSGFNTNPTPNQLFQQLPALYQKKVQKLQARRTKKLLKLKETPKSDVWMGAGLNNTWIVVDIANNTLMTIEYTGKALHLVSIRNLDVDLALPPGWDFHSDPPGEALLDQFRKANMARLEPAGLDLDDYGLRAYVAAHNHGGGGGAVGLQANCLNDKVVLDFTDQHKLLTYTLNNQSLDLIGDREYSMDIAVSLLQDALDRNTEAQNAYQDCHNHLPKSPVYAMTKLKFALENDPFLIDKVLKDIRITGDLGKDPDWDATIDKAHKDKDQAVQDRKDVLEAAKKLKEKDEADLKGTDTSKDDDSDDASDAPAAPAPGAGK